MVQSGTKYRNTLSTIRQNDVCRLQFLKAKFRNPEVMGSSQMSALNMSTLSTAKI